MLKGVQGNCPYLTSKEIDKSTQILRCDDLIKNATDLANISTVRLRVAKFYKSPPRRAKALNLGTPDGARAYYVSFTSN